MMKAITSCAIGLALLLALAYLLTGLPQYRVIPLQPSGIRLATDTPDGLPGLTSDVRLESRQFTWGFPFETVLYVNFEDDDVRQNWMIVGRARVDELVPYSVPANDGIGCPSDRRASTITMTGLENGHTYLVTIYYRPTSEEYITDCRDVFRLQRDGKPEQAADTIEKWRRYAIEWDDRLSMGTTVRLTPGDAGG